jgi:hypothetical protein
MTRPIPLFSDPVVDIINYLESALPLFVVAEDLTGWHKPEVRVTIQPTGGVVVNPHRIFRPVYDVNAYAPTKTAAMAAALEALRAIYTLKNQVLESGQVVTEVECSMPSDLTDPINNNPRFVFDASITMRTP